MTRFVSRKLGDALSGSRHMLRLRLAVCDLEPLVHISNLLALFISEVEEHAVEQLC